MFNGHRIESFFDRQRNSKLNYVRHKVCVKGKVCLRKCSSAVRSCWAQQPCVCVCVEWASRREMFLICVRADTLLRWRTDSLEFFTWVTSWERTDRTRGKRKNKSAYWVNGDCQLKPDECVFVEDAELLTCIIYRARRKLENEWLTGQMPRDGSEIIM